MHSSPTTVNLFFQKRLYGPMLGKSVEAASLSWHGYSGTDDATLQSIIEKQPSILIISCEWLNQGAERLIASVRRSSPYTHIVICCVQTTLPSFDILTPALVDADPDTFCHLPELTNCLRAVRAGQSFVSAFWSGHAEHALPANPLPGWQELSRQEQKIISLMVQGLKGPDIANLLFISEKTVNNHKLKISQKLQINGGPGSLTRFVLTERQSINRLLGFPSPITVA